MSGFKERCKEHAYECVKVANLFLVIFMRLHYKSNEKINVGYFLLNFVIKFLPR